MRDNPASSEKSSERARPAADPGASSGAVKARCHNEHVDELSPYAGARAGDRLRAAGAPRPEKSSRRPHSRSERTQSRRTARPDRERRLGDRALVAKFFAAIKAGLLLLPEAKLLTTSGTALVSVAAYSLFWGWPFAAGFVLLIFVHEMGHVIALRREGIKASAPMFVPFMGAVIAASSLGDNALAEARVGLAGPVLGTIGAAACWSPAS